MPKCQRICNLFGMKHCQALMLGFAYGLDSVKNFALSVLAQQKRITPKGNIPEEIMNETHYNVVLKYNFAAVGLGRALIALLILRVNNKYILLMFAVLEIVLLLIAHAMYLQKGLDALQWTFLVLDFVQGARWPLAMNIISKWSTGTTFTLMLWTFKGSTDLCSAFYYLIVEALKDYGVMTISIYLSVIVKGTFCILWITFGSGDPIHNIFISKDELLELRDDHRLRLKTHWKHKTPLKKILMTPILYGCFILHSAYLFLRTWENQSFIYPFAHYRHTGYWLPLFGFFMMIFAEGVIAFFVDFIIKKKKTTVNNIRKTCAAISAWGSGCCFLLIGSNLGKENTTLAFKILNCIFHTCNGLYDVVLIVHDVSPNYLGFTHCIISSGGHFLVGFKPLLDKSLAADAAKDPTRAMSLLLYFYGFYVYFACLAMLLSGNSRRRDYDSYYAVPWKEDSIISFP